jgi:hypothetical protein
VYVCRGSCPLLSRAEETRPVNWDGSQVRRGERPLFWAARLPPFLLPFRHHIRHYLIVEAVPLPRASQSILRSGLIPRKTTGKAPGQIFSLLP